MIEPAHHRNRNAELLRPYPDPFDFRQDGQIYLSYRFSGHGPNPSPARTRAVWRPCNAPTESSANSLSWQSYSEFRD